MNLDSKIFESPRDAAPGSLLSINGLQISRFLPADLPMGRLLELASELTPLTREGFLREQITPALFADVLKHLRTAHRLLIARDSQQQPLAFIAASLHHFENDGRAALMYHLEGIIVKPELEGTGFSSKFVATDVRDSGATHLGFHTQNGRMRSLGMKIAYLNDSDSVNLAAVIDTANLRGITDAERYDGESLYGDTQKFEKNAITGINWRKGDAQVCIGPVREEILR